jgi:hypothetical protein
MSSNTPDRAVEFFQQVVEPTVVEFLSNTASLRHGRLAALVLAGVDRTSVGQCAKLSPCQLLRTDR